MHIDLTILVGGSHQFVNQLIGVAFTVALAAVGTFLIVKLVDAVIGLRVDQEDKVLGKSKTEYIVEWLEDIAAQILVARQVYQQARRLKGTDIIIIGYAPLEPLEERCVAAAENALARIAAVAPDMLETLKQFTRVIQFHGRFAGHNAGTRNMDTVGWTELKWPRVPGKTAEG